ncbi:MAG: flagellar hook-basal body complex protein FliE [Roseiarcus sp.]|jgi:flagellar hook-basal body complex protein FliE
MIDGISALTSSKSSLGALGASGAAGSTASATGGADFSAMMNQISGDAIGSLKTAEAASIQGIQGSAPVHNVVESIMAAQRSLQSTLAIRDKAVAAYQEISRMAI